MAMLNAAMNLLLDDLPRKPLLLVDTPIIEAWPRFSQKIDSKANTKIWACREDCNSGLGFGGNKARKLEFVVPDALAQGSDTLVTTGGVQSNHMRQTAAAAARLGMKAVLIPRDMVDPGKDLDSYYAMGNVQLNSILGADTLEIGTTQEEALKWVEAHGGRPYWIPAGASQHPCGSFGYARWALQVSKWEIEHGVTFDAILAPCGGASTLAGIVLGSKITCSQRKIIGVSVFPETADVMESKVLSIAQKSAQALGLPTEFISKDDFRVDASYHCGAYGKYDSSTAEAIRLLATNEGVIVDPVYTGKTLNGLIHMIQGGQLDGAKNVLFVHTGGQTAISAYPSLK